MAYASARVRVGSFELDLRSGELRSVGADVATDRVILREQPFQVLRMLIERDGKIVTRDEIKKRLWPNDTIVDFDHSINVAIGVLRRALGDSAANPRYIETLARRGYRLLATVEWLESTPAVAEQGEANEATPFGDLTGRKVCQYRVLEVLGGGGMGMVYKAEDLKLGRRVALKFLPVDLAGDTIALQRLQREAQTASALNHPNICTIYDIEEYEGQSFIAMELLEGDTLQERLAALVPSPIPLHALIDIAIQICVGLEAAHSKAIVHRDIKPGNIFLTARGAVKLLDFGVAKLVAGEETAETRSVEDGRGEIGPGVPVGLTVPGAAVGTAGYMSPEQVRREALDGRSDLFSLGLVIYEMATGRRAFTGETAMAVAGGDSDHDASCCGGRQCGCSSGTGLRCHQGARERSRAAIPDGHRHAARSRKRASGAGATRCPAPSPLASSCRRSRRDCIPVDVALVASRQPGHARGKRHNRAGTCHQRHERPRLRRSAVYALRISLEQTPYLNVLADNKVLETLSEIGPAENATVTPELALQICRRTGSKVVVAPAIADAGNRLRLELKGVDCQSGTTISLIRQEAASRNDVVGTIGSAALQLRKELGEPAASAASYNVTLEEATSSSPDALELLTLGYRRQLAGSSLDAIQYYQRAVQMDPNLGLAHAALSSAYGNVGEVKLSATAGQRAFALRDRMTAPARFNAESTYHLQVTGDLEAACAVLTRWVEAFPHDLIARNNFASCLANLGEPDRALGESREAARLLPSSFTYWMWIGRSFQGGRMDEAETALADAWARGFDSPLLRDLQSTLAFFRNDDAALQELWTWAAGQSGAHLVIMGKAMIEATRGQFRAALSTQEAATAMSGGVSYALEMALMRTAVGLPPSVDATSTTSRFLGPRLMRALLAARTGHVEEARRAAEALRLEFPFDTIVQKYGLPLIEATVRLHLNDPAGAVTALAPATKYDLSYTNSIFPTLYSSYVRGTAYLQMNAFAPAAAEFQRIVTHPGLVGRWVFGPLARLQLARAERGMADDTAALSSYEAFLNLWRIADADIPLYQDAMAEFNALRNRP